MPHQPADACAPSVGEHGFWIKLRVPWETLGRTSVIAFSEQAQQWEPIRRARWSDTPRAIAFVLERGSAARASAVAEVLGSSGIPVHKLDQLFVRVISERLKERIEAREIVPAPSGDDRLQAAGETLAIDLSQIALAMLGAECHAFGIEIGELSHDAVTLPLKLALAKQGIEIWDVRPGKDID